MQRLSLLIILFVDGYSPFPSFPLFRGKLIVPAFGIRPGVTQKAVAKPGDLENAFAVGYAEFEQTEQALLNLQHIHAVASHERPHITAAFFLQMNR